MKYNIVLFLVISFSCFTFSQNKKVDTFGIKINRNLLDRIKEYTGKELVQNSVKRYRRSTTYAGLYEPYDSIVKGVRFKFVPEVPAYKGIDTFFSEVKKSGHYLYLTNLDFDDNYNVHYDIVIAPFKDQFSLLKFIGTDGINYDQTNDDVIQWFKKKKKEFDFQIFVVDLDRVEARILSNPKSFKKLGKEIYKFCPDVIDQGHPDMNDLVNHLRETKRMWFWWD